MLALGLTAMCGPGGPVGAEGPGTEPEPLGREVTPITNGTPDTTPSHSAVVALILGPRLCSGTLVAPRVVVTAAHCVRGITAAQTQVGFGTDVRSKEMVWVNAASVKANPKYDPQLLVNDVAVVELAGPAPAGVVPIPLLPPSLALGASDVGKPVVFAGFGTTSGATQGTAGTKLEVAATLNFVCTGGTDCNFDGARASPNTICYDQQPGGPCMGDSGGPAFVTVNGQQYVAGITSYGDPLCTTYGCSTKVDAFAGFIGTFVSSVTQALGESCGSAADCASGFCVQGVCCDKACSGAPACEACVASLGASADGTCTPLTGGCDDGNACTANKQCKAGQCVGEPIAGCAVSSCMVNVCDPATGQCADRALADGTPCDDGNACTSGDTCRAGACGGELPACPASGACAGACIQRKEQRHAGCGYGFGEADLLPGIAGLALLALRRRRRAA